MNDEELERRRRACAGRTAALARRSVWIPSAIIGGAVAILSIAIVALLLEQLGR